MKGNFICPCTVVFEFSLKIIDQSTKYNQSTAPIPDVPGQNSGRARQHKGYPQPTQLVDFSEGLHNGGQHVGNDGIVKGKEERG
jgi:hypothetical protein